MSSTHVTLIHDLTFGGAGGISKGWIIIYIYIQYTHRLYCWYNTYARMFKITHVYTLLHYITLSYSLPYIEIQNHTLISDDDDDDDDHDDDDVLSIDDSVRCWFDHTCVRWMAEYVLVPCRFRHPITSGSIHIRSPCDWLNHHWISILSWLELDPN